MSMPAELVSSDMNLNTLLHGLADAPAIAINGIAMDSRLVRQGFVFLACEGGESHGIDYAGQAIASGAAAIVYDSNTADAATISIASHRNRWFATAHRHDRKSLV